MTSTTDFGFQDIPPDEKSERVRDIFTRVAGSYDRMNDAMSLFQHRLWKYKFVAQLPLLHRPANINPSYVDVSAGSGDITLRILKALGRQEKSPSSYSNTSQAHGKQHPIDACGTENAEDHPPQGTPGISSQKLRPYHAPHLTLVDPTKAMLDLAKNRLIDHGYVQDIAYVEAPAESLPFPPANFDLYTISFGLRNVADRAKSLAEAHRVLKPGGWFYCLEFSHPIWPGFDKLYDLYSFNVIPKLGKWIAQDEAAYQYLVESIRRFPKQSVLIDELHYSGFTNTSFTNIAGGIVAIHCGQNPSSQKPTRRLR